MGFFTPIWHAHQSIINRMVNSDHFSHLFLVVPVDAVVLSRHRSKWYFILEMEFSSSFFRFRISDSRGHFQSTAISPVREISLTSYSFVMEIFNCNEWENIRERNSLKRLFYRRMIWSTSKCYECAMMCWITNDFWMNFAFVLCNCNCINDIWHLWFTFSVAMSFAISIDLHSGPNITPVYHPCSFPYRIETNRTIWREFVCDDYSTLTHCCKATA